ncbi:unnamed protein product [Danaus chrysippus]|uniref:(African queen) hypothetical protein n=1 Tax=Danaus chrysippus TaxID=151541 RepID=A0A8J2VU85_9NEOP|nr:unnamed protein product [Danaus chrysippus]
MSCIRILPVIALFLIQYTTQSELDRDDDVSMIVVKPPALRTNDYVTVEEIYPTKEALRRPRFKSRNRNKSRNKKGGRPSKPSKPTRPPPNTDSFIPPIEQFQDMVDSINKSDEEEPVVVLLFSNSVFDHISGGNINFDGTTDIKVDQKDQTSKKLKYVSAFQQA